MGQSYSNTLVLSKLKIGQNYYYLKDADARAILDGCGDVITHNMATAITDGDGKIADAAVVKAYVDQEVKAVPRFHAEVYDTLPTASADTMYILALVKNTQSAAGEYIEYITVRSGEEGSYTYAWEQIGTTKIDLSGYVNAVAYTDARELQITKGTVTSTVHTFGKLADKDSATGTVEGQTITGVKATYTAAGTVGVELEQTATDIAVNAKADYTPAGSITGDAIKGGSIEVTVKDAETATEASLTKATYTPTGSVAVATSAATATLSRADYTPAGNVTVNDLTQTSTAAALTKEDYTPAGTISGKVTAEGSVAVTADTASVLSGIKTAAVAPTFTQGAKATLTAQTTDKFAKAGVIATVGTGDDAECLIFTDATTADAVTDRGTFTANGEDTFDAGSAAEFNTADVVTGATASFTGSEVAIGATFTGTKAASLIVTAVNYDKATANGASFEGSKAEGLKVTEVSYAKANAEATFTASNSVEVVNKVEYLKQEINTATFTPEAASLSFTGTAATITATDTVKYDKATVKSATFTGTADQEATVGTITVADKSVTVE